MFDNRKLQLLLKVRFFSIILKTRPNRQICYGASNREWGFTLQVDIKKYSFMHNEGTVPGALGEVKLHIFFL